MTGIVIISVIVLLTDCTIVKYIIPFFFCWEPTQGPLGIHRTCFKKYWLNMLKRSYLYNSYSTALLTNAVGKYTASWLILRSYTTFFKGMTSYFFTTDELLALRWTVSGHFWIPDLKDVRSVKKQTKNTHFVWCVTTSMFWWNLTYDKDPVTATLRHCPQMLW